jgi:hypothetical protein
MRTYYLLLTVFGLVLPYSYFVPWVLQHGLNLPLFLFMRERHLTARV